MTTYHAHQLQSLTAHVYIMLTVLGMCNSLQQLTHGQPAEAGPNRLVMASISAGP